MIESKIIFFFERKTCDGDEKNAYMSIKFKIFYENSIKDNKKTTL